ncbi:biotin--[acetyl-CoA-carboxylase] ligase [uncultured Treponema sp.]|uniref:biotin--[acetyl-CoA-carboxylase] ligase n=1 Tax=uncultured Treponema sp. TaxID=162155 RepID=UPI000E9195DA|nr:biotin--[acetyl-CoA-carboxylase] ligase [uncultured Treponema sp.]HAZ97482.1 biotin--[acetyl-CoA-carboxylase] ligase [Treponema sp.]
MANEFEVENVSLDGWKKYFKIQLFKEIDSTNSELVRRGNSLLPLLNEDGSLTVNGGIFNNTLVLAESQTSGHGRLGRFFYSPSLTGAYFSFSVVKEGGIKNPAMFTVSSAVGVCRAIKKLFGTTCSIKWVNDVFCGGKKVCGILTEGIVNSSKGIVEAAVVGIGINLATQNDFPKELREKAGGISSEEFLSEKKIDSQKLIFCCMDEITAILASGENVIPEYKKLSCLLGKELDVSPVIGQEKSFKAKALDITDDAGLLVELADGTKKILHSGEVTLHSFLG